METEGMDYNTGKFGEDMGVLSGIFCRVPDHLLPSVLSTNHLLFFFVLTKQTKATAATLQDSDVFFWCHDWFSGKELCPLPCTDVYLPEKRRRLRRTHWQQTD